MREKRESKSAEKKERKRSATAKKGRVFIPAHFKEKQKRSISKPREGGGLNTQGKSHLSNKKEEKRKDFGSRTSRGSNLVISVPA